MKIYRFLFFLLVLVISCIPFKKAYAALTFDDFGESVFDSRDALNRFHDIIEADMFAFRLEYSTIPKGFLFEMEDGSILSGTARRVTFQGMFWSPLFTSAVLLPPAFVLDIILATFGFNYMALTRGNIHSLKKQLDVSDALGREELPMNRFFRINVLFSSDLYLLNIYNIDNSNESFLYGVLESGEALMGRSFAGIAMKFMEAYHLFGGFSFIHFPHIKGYQDFLNNVGFTGDGFSTYYRNNDSDIFLYETRAQLFLHHNFFDLIQLRSLFNIGAEKALDLLGFGFVFNWIKNLDLSAYISYLNLLEKFSLDFDGRYFFSDYFYLFGEYKLSVSPFILLDHLKAGVYYQIGEKWGAFLSAYAMTFHQSAQQRFGFSAKIGMFHSRIGQTSIDISHNADESMFRNPLSRDTWIIKFSVEIGMGDLRYDKDYSRNIEEGIHSALTHVVNYW